MKKSLIPSAIVLMAAPAFAAPIALTGSMHYLQDFNALAKAPDNNTVAAVDNWSDDTTIPGWFFFQAGNGVAANTKFAGANFPYRVTDGSLQTGQAAGSPLHTGWFYSMGTVQADPANGDRAIGVVPISAQGELSYLVVFQNTSTAPLRLNQIAYNAEIWRTNQNSGANTSTVETIAVSWRKAATQAELLTMSTAAVVAADWTGLATAPNSYQVIGWTRLPNADYTYTSTVANTKTYESHPVSAVPAAGIEILPGEFFALRWSNLNDRDADALMGIDDLDLTFATSEYTIAGVAANAVRSDGGTPRNPDDDTVSFDLTVNGTGAIAPAWNISSPASLATVTGAYGATVNVTGVPIALFTGASHSLQLTVADQNNAAFTSQVSVVAPWGTIIPQPATNFAYLDKGTADTSDDEVTFSLQADGTFTGTGFTTSAGSGTYGIPLTVSVPAPGTFTTFTFTDSADPSIKATLDVFPPAIIGTDATTLSPRPLISIPTGQNGAIRWNVNAATGVLQQTGGTVQADSVLLSEIVDISAAPAVSFTATLAAVSGTSSGFEAEDSFALDLIIDGTPVSALGASDTGADGRLAGASELQAAAGLTRTFNFAYTIPATANSVQVRIVGNSNSTSETFNLSAVKLEIPQPAIQLSAASNIIRNANGPGATDDTVSFDVTVTGVNGGAGWTATGATPATGAFGLVTFTVPAGSNSATVRITDNTFPNAFADVTVPLPGPYIIGTVDTGAGSAPLFTDGAAPPDNAWVISGTPPSLTMNGAGLVAPFKTVTTEAVSVAGATGPLLATAHLHVNDTTSGFEAADEFNAYVILDGNVAAPLSMITAWDKDSSGTMAGDELCPAGPVNPTIQNFDYPLSVSIPAGTTTVQIIITGLCNSDKETMTVSAVSIATGAADTDADGISDAYEDANGLDKNSNADRNLDLDGDGQSNYLEFVAGTAANNDASVLKIVDRALDAATGAASVTWTSVAGKRYRVQLSPDMGIWTDVGSQVTASGASTTTGYTIPGAPLTGKGFLRVKVVP